MRLLFVIIVALIVHGSFFPWSFEFRPLDASPLWILVHSWPSIITRSIVRDVGVNVGVYFPLGISGYLAFARARRSWVKVTAPVLVGACLSVTVECLQLFQATRVCSMLDVICNISGAAAGVFVAARISTRVHHLWVRNLLLRADVLVVAAAWLLWQLFPLIPVWKWTLLQQKLLTLTTWTGGAAALATAFTGWLVAACILEALGTARSARWLATLAMAIVPARVLIHGRLVAIPEILGTLLAVAVWAFGLSGRPFRTRMVGAIGILYLCMRQLLPFEWLAGAEEFVWIPFTASLEVDSLQAFATLIEKAFFYSGVVWVLWWSGVTLRRSTAATVGLLALTEVIQTCIPGRVPETTDGLLALLAGVVFGMGRKITAEEMANSALNEETNCTRTVGV